MSLISSFLFGFISSVVTSGISIIYAVKTTKKTQSVSASGYGGLAEALFKIGVAEIITTIGTIIVAYKFFSLYGLLVVPVGKVLTYVAVHKLELLD